MSKDNSSTNLLQSKFKLPYVKKKLEDGQRVVLGISQNLFSQGLTSPVLFSTWKYHNAKKLHFFTSLKHYNYIKIFIFIITKTTTNNKLFMKFISSYVYQVPINIFWSVFDVNIPGNDIKSFFWKFDFSLNHEEITHWARVLNCAASAIAGLHYCPSARSSSWECCPKQTPPSAHLPLGISPVEPSTSASLWHTSQT